MSKRIARTTVLLVVVVATGIAACSDDPASPGAPQALIIESGNNQTGTPGQALTLEVRVTDEVDQPYQGVTVGWAVLSGDGQVDPPSTTTDSRGVAATTLTLGDAHGEVLIEANADGLAAVSFNAMAGGTTDCNAIDLVIGTSTGGTLTDEDCQRSTGSASHHYSVSVEEPVSLLITETTSAFDAYLEVTDATGKLIAFSDDISESDSNSELRAFLAPGDYVVVASGYGPSDLGDYTLNAVVEDSPVTDCLFNVWTVPSTEVQQDLAASDCNLSDSGGTVYYADAYLMHLQEGTSFTAIQTSDEISVYLELYGLTSNGFVYIGVADGSGGSEATMTYTAPVTGAYLLLPSSAGGSETGAYTLSIE